MDRMHFHLRRGECWCRCLYSRCEGVRRAWMEGLRGKDYSRAQRYGSNPRIFARAHVCRLKGYVFEAIGNIVCCN